MELLEPQRNLLCNDVHEIDVLQGILRQTHDLVTGVEDYIDGIYHVYVFISTMYTKSHIRSTYEFYISFAGEYHRR